LADKNVNSKIVTISFAWGSIIDGPGLPERCSQDLFKNKEEKSNNF